MTFLDIYYYLFYKIFRVFKFIEPSSENVRLLKVKTASIFGILEFFTVVSFAFYKSIIFKEYNKYSFFYLGLFIPAVIVTFINWLMFVRNDNWMEYVEKFDKWPKAKNQKGDWIVLGVVVLLIVNFVLSVRFSPFYRP